MITQQFNNRIQWIKHILNDIEEIANTAIDRRGVFHIVLCGGETPQPIYKALMHIKTNWDLWQFWIGDERAQADEFNELNSSMVQENLFQHLSLSSKQVHLIDVQEGIEKAVENYVSELSSVDFFDLVLLGIGEDGHTASLFPGNYLGVEKGSPDVVSISNSPKPPMERVTLTARRLSLSRKIMFLAYGSDKRDIINTIQKSGNLPIHAIKGIDETILYYYD